jgi:hypothetical protein
MARKYPRANERKSISKRIRCLTLQNQIKKTPNEDAHAPSRAEVNAVSATWRTDCASINARWPVLFQVQRNSGCAQSAIVPGSVFGQKLHS